jgi:hypothetical protein
MLSRKISPLSPRRLLLSTARHFGMVSRNYLGCVSFELPVNPTEILTFFNLFYPFIDFL